jgi:hypothetical protein
MTSRVTATASKLALMGWLINVVSCPPEMISARLMFLDAIFRSTAMPAGGVSSHLHDTRHALSSRNKMPWPRLA